jgi:tripartite ATP-independent transporter DctM subunit
LEALLIAALALVALSVGLPIAFVILLVVWVLVFTDPFVNASAVPSLLIQGMDSFILLSIPLFVLVGVIMNSGGITQRLLDLAVVLVGHLRAGVAQVNILASMIFSGMSGTSTSDVAGLGRVEIPMMIRNGFRPETAAVITAVSATIGPILPPSVPFILYGALTGVSVGQLFLGGVIPGLLLGFWLMAIVALLARTGRISSARLLPKRSDMRSIMAALRESSWALLTPVILVSGIVAGTVTPTETAGVALIYAIFIVRYVYRAVTFRAIFAMFCESAEYVGVIMLVVAAANAFGWLMTQAGTADAILDLVKSSGFGPLTTLLLLNVALLVLGTVIEATSMIIMLSPILVPLIVQIGVDPVHFGVLFVLNIMIAVITPPIGICGMIASDIAGVTMQRFAREALPYIAAMIVFLFFVVLTPAVVTYLPRLVFGTAS